MTAPAPPRFGRPVAALAFALGPAVAAAQAPPPAPPALPATTFPEAPVNDHARAVGSFGVGWFGVSNVPVATEAGAKDAIAAPAVGVRYWFGDLLGVDVGLGFATSSSSSETGGNDVDGLSRTAFLVHGGVPLALATGRHYIFEVVPELNLGFATGNSGDANDVDLSGSRFELGARAGTEVQFGFLGIPELALEASVGLFLRADSYKASPPNAPKISGSDFLLSTSNINNPWDFFRSNVAARYYF
jgi:hypothetical protein